jgi:hypothetical protein
VQLHISIPACSTWLSDCKDFFYVCPGHLKDRYFCSPKIDEEAVKAKREKELAEEKEKLKKEYEEKQRKKKEKKEKEAKEKEKDKGKDKDKDDKKDDSDQKDDDKSKDEVSATRRMVSEIRLTLPRRKKTSHRPPKKRSLVSSNSRGLRINVTSRDRIPLTHVVVPSTRNAFRRRDKPKPRGGTANGLLSLDTSPRCPRTCRESEVLHDPS